VRKKISSPWTQHLLPSGTRTVSRTWRFQEVEELKSKIEEIKDFRKSKNWSRKFKKSKIEAFEDGWRLKFWDSTRVCNSNWVSGATDMDMPFGYSRISIPGPTH
jgi:hypothetical protein